MSSSNNASLRAYLMGDMSFSLALAAMKDGFSVKRRIWSNVSVLISSSMSNNNRVKIPIIRRSGVSADYYATPFDLMAEDWIIHEDLED